MPLSLNLDIMKKERISLEFWEDTPEDMKKYLKNYSWHFNHKIYKYAVSQMYKKTKDGKEEKIEPIEKEKLYELLKKYNVILENDTMYDATYLYSMAMADYVGNAFNEETTMKWIKCTIDDVDSKDGEVFHTWYAKMCFNGVPIDWEEFV